MKNVLLLFLLVVGVASHGMGKNVRLHGSLKEFGANVVSMDFDGAAGELSKEWSQKITVNKDGSFVHLWKPCWFLPQEASPRSL